MSVFRVACGHAPALWFDTAHTVFRAFDAADVRSTIDGAEAALNDGFWIAGYFSYELGAAIAGLPVRQTGWPLAAIGVFSPPEERALDFESNASMSPLVATIARSEYDAAIASIRRQIYDGEVYQVNFTLPFAFQVDGDPLAWWSSIARETGARYQAFVEDGDRVACSWSPELFLAFDGARIETRPMKGTATLDALEELAMEKNRAEHIMIVDLLRNDLHRIAGNVRVESLFSVERYPTFATMTSTIAGHRRDDASLFDVLRATFPCGSVTGAPKRAAIGQIAAHEPAARGVYCGSIGYLSPQRRGWWNVAIRTAQLDRSRDTARFDAGGGIVADSSADAEWNEVLVKTRFIRARAEPPELWEAFASDASAEVLGAHFARLAATAERFGITYDARGLRGAVEALLATARDLRLVRLRLYADGTHALLSEALVRDGARVDVCVATERVQHDDPFLRWKTAWRPVQRRAAERAREDGCFDALLLNERDELTEGTRTNLFIESDGTLWTPPVECGLLPGILRQHLVSGGQARERVLTLDDLARADAVFVGNSARGLLRARVTEEQS
jgi:para-aminobenzoate synthetase/4-amino-4-deoxychorismate lyase